jgi:hypothetical protein
MFNLITVCTGPVPTDFARKMENRLRQVTSLPFEHICITDRPSEVLNFAHPYSPKLGVPGWWNKIEMYGTHMTPGWSVYIDLDVIIMDNFDDTILWVMENDPDGKSISCVTDTLRWHDNTFNSSFMVFKPENHRNIFDKFSERKEEIMGTWPGGDQVWIGKIMRPSTIYLEAQFPNLKKNLKFDLSNKVGGQWQIPHEIPAGIKLVDCSGRPKPHELGSIPFIKRNWFDI